MRPSANASAERLPSAAMVMGASISKGARPRDVQDAPATNRPSRPSRTTGARATTSSLNSAPARAAALTSAQSRSSRGRVRPRTAPGYRASTTTPSPVTRIPSTGIPRFSTLAARPSRRRTANAPGFNVSPHSLGLGNVARSIRQTRAPARASTVAATHPLGPAPITRTSIDTGLSLHSAYDDGAVLRAEAETVAQGSLDARRTPGVRHIVEVAGRI